MNPEPGPENRFLADHVTRLRRSYRHWTGRDLIDPDLLPEAAARRLYHADFALLSHSGGDDPVFDYANRTAQRLFEMDWHAFVRTPSRLSAEAPLREQREYLLRQVARQGYIDDYAGIRISRGGRRFRIERATVWNVIDEAGRVCGQAACFDRWHWLDGPRTP